MQITLMHISSSAIEGVRKALKEVYRTELLDPPRVTTDYVHHEPTIQVTSSELAAMVKVKHQTLGGSGFIAVFISKGAAEKLAETGNPGKVFTEEEIHETFGKFCDVLIEAFSSRLFSLRQGVFDVSKPVLFKQGANEKVKGLDISQKQVVLFLDNDKPLVKVEAGYQGEKLAR